MLGQVAVVDGTEDRVAVTERLDVLVLHAGQRPTVAGEDAALDDASLVRRPLQLLFTQNVRVGQLLGEVDSAGPVLGAGVDTGFYHQHVELLAGQPQRGGDPGRSAANDDHIPKLLAHRRSLVERSAPLALRQRGAAGWVEAS